MVKANAQIQLEDYFGYVIPDNANDLILVSDKKIPIHDGVCRKLCPEITMGSKGMWARYYFQDAPQTEQWYKNFVFLKLLTPNKGYYNERISVFDVANNKYWEYINSVDNKTYMHLTDAVPDANQNYFYFDANSEVANLAYSRTPFKDVYFLSPVIKQDTCFLTFLNRNVTTRGQVYFYKLTNTDFINDKIPDNGVNKKANYLFLQRDYKLGNKYNTVIFPVDVPVKDYNHLYNNGANRLIVYRLESIGENSMNFVKDIGGVLKANTPYIIKSEKNDQSLESDIVSEYYMTESPVQQFDINCVMQVMESNGVRVFAQYKRLVVQKNENISPDEDIYVVSNNKLVNCRNIEQTRVGRFRWYIKRPRNASSIPMTITFDGTTDIDSVVSEDVKADNNIYNLNGQKIGTLDDINNIKKGYYIVNGKVRLLAE